MELNPQQRKKEVINHLCLPIAYSLIIRQLGLNSGLTKCSISRQSKDKAAQLIVKRANALILFNEFFLEQFVELIHAHGDALLKAHLHNFLQLFYCRVDKFEFNPGAFGSFCERTFSF
jgi:hypothetical protein